MKTSHFHNWSFPVLLIAIVLSGCGTVMHGKTQNVIIETDPSNAVAKTDDGQSVTTPGTLVLKREKKSYSIIVEKEGFEPASTAIEREVSWWLAGNIVAGGIIGLIVDFVTGGAYDLDPERVHVKLIPGKGSDQLLSKSSAKALPQTTSDVDSVRLVGRRRAKAHAIIVGVEQYRQNLPRADFAFQDATIMREYVTKSLGYPEENVVLLLNDHATKSDLDKYFEQWLPNRVEKDDSVFIYFSGHGAPNSKTGEAFIVPYDGDPAFVDKTGYPLKRLYDHVGQLPAKEVIIIIDSCFSGAGGRSVVAKGMRPIALSIENPIVASGKTIVMTAGAGDQISSTYDQKRHGLLTYFVLKGLQGEADVNKDGAIDVNELFTYVKPQVERTARREFNSEQAPQLFTSPELFLNGVRLIEPVTP